MPRISDAIIEERTEILQGIMEQHPEGLSINELLVILKEKGVTLPKSEYQAIHIILTNAEKKGVAIREGSKWTLAFEEDAEDEESDTDIS